MNFDFQRCYSHLQLEVHESTFGSALMCWEEQRSPVVIEHSFVGMKLAWNYIQLSITEKIWQILIFILIFDSCILWSNRLQESQICVRTQRAFACVGLQAQLKCHLVLVDKNEFTKIVFHIFSLDFPADFPDLNAIFNPELTATTNLRSNTGILVLRSD